jgi:hypothetical protein
VPNVQWKNPDDGQRNCPKHLDFLDKNKLGKLVRLLVLLKRTLFGLLKMNIFKHAYREKTNHYTGHKTELSRRQRKRPTPTVTALVRLTVLYG